ncbi:MAG: 2-C-methyl-D-erythritol 4-phosphate cytidylyltransferase, partial [Jatrophihabitantaceae bacterium]
VDLVLVHDVARAFVQVQVISRVIDALRGGADAVVPTLAVADTVRAVDPVSGLLGQTVDRAGLVVVQTPQGFDRRLLVRAHAQASTDQASDDASLIEAIGATVSAVAGDEDAFKITRPLDLALAELVAAKGVR